MSDRWEPASPLQKAFAVIKVLAETGYPMNAPDIGAQLDLNRQTVHRLLNQLEAIGMVRRGVVRERFEVGPALVKLGLDAQTGNLPAKLRRAVMEQLVAEVSESCNLAVLDGQDVVFIDRAECDWPLRRQTEIGNRMPAYGTAIGKVVLANLPPKQLNQFLSTVHLRRMTENTHTDPEALREHLAEVRDQGYAINNEENLVGVLGVAVPVWDPSGSVVAGVAVHGPKARLTETRATEIVPQLKKAADAIGKRLLDSDADGIAGS